MGRQNAVRKTLFTSLFAGAIFVAFVTARSGDQAVSFFHYLEAIRGKVYLARFSQTGDRCQIMAFDLPKKELRIVREFAAENYLREMRVSDDGSVLTGIFSTEFGTAADNAVLYLDLKTGERKRFTLGGKAARGGAVVAGGCLFLSVCEYADVQSHLPWEKQATTVTLAVGGTLPVRINLKTGEEKKLMNPVDQPKVGDYEIAAKCSGCNDMVIYARSGYDDMTGYYAYDLGKKQFTRLRYPCFSIAYDGRFISEDPPDTLSAIDRSADPNVYLEPYGNESYSGKHQDLLKIERSTQAWDNFLGLSPCGRFYAFSRTTRSDYSIKVLDLKEMRKINLLKVKTNGVNSPYYLGWIR